MPSDEPAGKQRAGRAAVATTKVEQKRGDGASRASWITVEEVRRGKADPRFSEEIDEVIEIFEYKWVVFLGKAVQRHGSAAAPAKALGRSPDRLRAAERTGMTCSAKRRAVADRVRLAARLERLEVMRGKRDAALVRIGAGERLHRRTEHRP